MKQTIRIKPELISGTVEAKRLHDAVFSHYQDFVAKKIISWRSPVDIDSSLLRHDVITWLKLHNASYSVVMRFDYQGGIENLEWDGVECIYEIELFDPDTALLFKLTWSGAIDNGL